MLLSGTVLKTPVLAVLAARLGLRPDGAEGRRSEAERARNARESGGIAALMHDAFWTAGAQV
jgi:hypothetical protein